MTSVARLLTFLTVIASLILGAATVDARSRRGTRSAGAEGASGTTVLLEEAFAADEGVRDAALRELARRGAGALDALPLRVLDAAPRDVGPYARAVAALPPAKRREAALLWARFGPPAWIPSAAVLLQPAQPESLRAAIAHCGASEPARAALLRLLEQRAGEWRAPAVRLQRDGDWMDDPFVVRVFGALAEPADRTAIDVALRSPDPRVLVEVAAALGVWGGSFAGERLLPLLGRGHALRVRVAAARALAEAGDGAAARRLWPLVAEGPEELTQAAIEAIGRLRGEVVFSEMESAFATRDRATRRAVLLACKEIGGPDALRLLSRAAADGDPAIRELGLTLLAAP